MTKKVVGKDPRADADDETVPAEQFRVDRVFGGGAPKRESMPNMRESVPNMREAQNRKPATLPPINTTSSEAGDTELALRRQLSRLQRQLSDAQRELANKDEEVAAAVEKRVELAKQYEELVVRLRDTQAEVDDLKDAKSLAAGIEQRLQDAVAAADELNHQLERERSERATIASQLEQTNLTFEKARMLWKEETALAEQHHAAELDKSEQARRAAIEQADAAKDAALARQKQAHEAELETLRASHERELSVVRGELEPKVAEARNLAGEIERLTSELAAARAEHMRELGERAELFKWEQQQANDTFAAQLATAERKLESEKAAVEAELAALKDTLGITERNATLREQLWEQTAAALRESQKKLQQELAEAKERATQAEEGKSVVDGRLALTLQQLDELLISHRDLEMRVEAAEAEARRNTLDRQRFAAYLEEGLAMVGALPPKPVDSVHGEFEAHESSADDEEPLTRESASEVTVNDRPRRTSEPAPNEERDLDNEVTTDALPERARRESAEQRAKRDSGEQRAKRDSASGERAKRDSENAPNERAKRDSENAPNERAKRDSANAPTTDEQRAKRDSASAPNERAKRDSAAAPNERAKRDSAAAPNERAKRDSAAAPNERAKRDSANVPPGPSPDEVPARDSELEMSVTSEPAEASSEPDALPNPPDPHNDVTRA